MNYKSSTEKAENALQNKTRGVRRLPHIDRPSGWGVEWRVEGKPKREYYATEALRDERYAELVKERHKGATAQSMSRSETAEYRAIKAAIGDVPWQDMIAEWRTYRQMTGKEGTTKTVQEAKVAYMEYLTQRLSDGGLSKDSFRHKKRDVGLFADALGANRLDQIKPEVIEGWIDDLGHESAFTFNSIRKTLRAFFGHFKKDVSQNPVSDVKPRKAFRGEVDILTVDDTQKLLNFALANYPESLGRLALEAFVGIRFSSAVRLEKKDINFEDRGILLPAKKIKTGIRTGRRHYIDKLPDNVWPWIAATNDACWAMENSHWMHLKSRIFRESGVVNPGNALRHNFCTYHVAAFKDPGKTATILCHRDQDLLWSTYNGVATQSAGKRYFEILPVSA